MPILADKRPRIAEMMMTFFRRLASSRAVDEGVINIATTRITPTLLKAENNGKGQKEHQKVNELSSRLSPSFWQWFAEKL